MSLSVSASTSYNINIISSVPINPHADSSFIIVFQFIPSNNTPQQFAIFVGNSTSDLQHVAIGYTNQTKYGYAKVSVINAQIEYINIVWVKYNYIIITIYPYINQTTTNITTTINLTSSSQINFGLPSWANWVISAAVMLILIGLGWKFMGTAGLLIFSIAGIILLSVFSLIPFWTIYVLIFILALIGAKVISSALGGSDEE
ncbi:hypothetical protein V6M85_13580 [Sulfolobus tengchongensis]|uniref:Uncharacterized protein n=1 Tax=Sulfolobus tengchongensis TaxID=207809 RepID=A0AAX4L0Z7_9CREN